MSMALCFWVVMLVWFVFGLAMPSWKAKDVNAASALTFVLFLLLGWSVFGAPIK